ncbi:MAG: hypothetical protein MJZ34_02875 [Paludibacteraceae bacterium]|nr:hypothetical protein [Paludibacteraceae bacterium]
MIEPNVKSTVYDMSGGLLPAPADDGFNIVMPVFTPTGPVEKTKVFSQKDFIDRFMTNTKMLPTDNMSAQFAYMVLNQNPVYVIRACPTELREGMSCEGTTYLFDSEYNLLDSYKKFNFDIAPNTATFAITPAIGSPMTSEEGESLEHFIETLEEKYNGQGILSSNNELVVSTTKLSPSSNIGKFEESIKTGAFQMLQVSAGELQPYDYVSMNGNSYQYLKSVADETSDGLSNVQGFIAGNNNDARYFILFVLGEENCLHSLKDVKLKLDSCITDAKGISGITFSDNALAIESNSKISPKSLGEIADPMIKKILSDIEEDLGKEEGVKPGFKYAVKTEAGYDIYTVSSIKNAASQNNVADFAEEASEEVTGKFPAAPTANEHFTKDTTGQYIVTKDANGILAKYDLGLTDVFAVEGGTYTKGTPIAESTVGNTCLVFKTQSVTTTDENGEEQTTNENTLQISKVVSVCDEYSDAVAYAFASDIPQITLTDKDDNEHLFLCSTDNLSSAFKDENIRTLNASHSVEFVIDVIKMAANENGAIHSAFGDKKVTTEGTIRLYNPSYGSTVVSSDAISLINTDEMKTYYYAVDPVNNDSLIKYESIKVVIGDKMYYTGSVAPSYTSLVKLKGSSCSEEEFMSLLQNALADANIYMYNGDFISTDPELNIQTFDGDQYTMELTVDEAVEQSPTEAFAVVAKFPSSAAVTKYSYEFDSESEIVSMNFNYKDGVYTEDWTFSFVPGVVDGYGVDQWYTRVNSDYIKVVQLNEDAKPLESFTSRKFGNKIGLPQYAPQHLTNAISKLSDYEDDIAYDVISDAGVCDGNLAATISQLAAKLYSVYPASLPPFTKVKDIKSYIGAIEGIHHYEVRMLSASDRIAVAGYSEVFPGSFKLIGQMVSAFRNPSTEFAPNFDLNHGSVGMNNPVQSWKRNEREELLDLRVETLKGGVTTPFYINDNITAQTPKSYLSEDQNVRMTNCALHAVQKMAKNYIGELNTKALRDRVQENVNSLIQDRLFKGRTYSPAQYLAVCDDTNNPIHIIEQNKLVISLYASFTPSIKYVLVDHYIVSLSQTQE